MSPPKSRYDNLPVTRLATTQGVSVELLPAAPRGNETLQGFHKRRDRERLDHLAHVYLKDATAFYRIADLNEAILPDSLDQAQEIAIPARGR
jgi:hypothetical protein